MTPNPLNTCLSSTLSGELTVCFTQTLVTGKLLNSLSSSYFRKAAVMSLPLPLCNINHLPPTAVFPRTWRESFWNGNIQGASSHTQSLWEGKGLTSGGALLCNLTTASRHTDTRSLLLLWVRTNDTPRGLSHMDPIPLSALQCLSFGTPQHFKSLLPFVLAKLRFNLDSLSLTLQWFSLNMTSL